MSRRINFTGRRRIVRDRVHLHLGRSSSGVLTATMEALNLDGLDLPSHSRIVVEIYHQTYFHRFECGTVGDPILPSASEISDFDAPNILKCRVKVLGAPTTAEAGKILAQADRMPVHTDGEGIENTGILRIGPGDLGSLLWSMDFEDGPQLLINSDTEDWREVAHNAWFKGLVFPEAVRRISLWVLERLREGDEPSDDEDLANWCLYLRTELHMDPVKDVLDSDLEPEEWSANAAKAFAESFHIERLWMPLVVSGDEAA